MQTKRILFVCAAFSAVYLLFASVGVVSVKMAENTAVKYVSAQHPQEELAFSSVVYSDTHGTYFAEFTDGNGKSFAFQLNSKFFPTEVIHDPIMEEQSK